jgi:hypothetical protein
MTFILKRLIIIASAIAIAILSYYFLNGWYNVIPWALASIVAGYFSLKRIDIVINGGLLGYFIFVTYILIGYTGKSDTKSSINIFIFSMLFSLIGAVAGIIGTLPETF